MDFAHRYSIRRQKERALELLTQLEIGDHAYKRPGAISGGQQQRVAIARAMANDPPLLVADEPTGSLDSNTAASVLAIFKALAAQGKTVVLVSHDPDIARQATRAITLADGRIVEPTAQ
jgi:putative ABC transport system ATP-binding protein